MNNNPSVRKPSENQMMANYRKGNLLILLATAVVIFVSAKSLRAATYYWDTNQGTAGLGDHRLPIERKAEA